MRIALSLLLAVLLGACERPFVDEQRPEVEVVSPDLSVVQTHPTLALRLSASSFRAIDSVVVNGLSMAYEPETGLWARDLTLPVGLTSLFVTALDRQGVAQRDTFYALRLPLAAAESPLLLPAPRGGHAATPLADGTLLVTGGAPGVNRAAYDSALLLPPHAAAFTPVQAPMRSPRVGHTATRLPDGRVLLLGGSVTDALDEIDDLVDPVELYDPATGTFRQIPYLGPPIRRAYHSAVVEQNAAGLYIDLYGGRGDIRYGSAPRLGIRRDFSSYLFRNDSLLARSPAPGHSLAHGRTVWGHTATPLASLAAGQPNRYLIAGSDFTAAGPEDGSFLLDYTTPRGITSLPLAPLRVPRRRHAAVLLRSGYIVIFGGMQDQPADVTTTPEVYSAQAGRFFRYPTPLVDAAKRYGATATKSGFTRILLIGGFSPAGNGMTTTEVFETPLF